MAARFVSAWVTCFAVCVGAVPAPDNIYYITVQSSNGSTAVGVINNSSFGEHSFSVNHGGGVLSNTNGDTGNSETPRVGHACSWGDLRGACVAQRQCLTTLDPDSAANPMCPSDGGEPTICCTDCELVNSTSNAVYRPDSGLGLFWKTGEKAWDRCLQNLIELPTKCHPYVRGRVRRTLNQQKQCHEYQLSSEGQPSPDVSRMTYSHSAIIGYGSSHVFSMAWISWGTILSHKFVLSAAQWYRDDTNRKGAALYAALGVVDRDYSAAGAARAQHRRIVRYVPHPEFAPPYGAHDLALYEMDSPISFNKFVSPACLPSRGDSVEPAELILATWRSLNHSGVANGLSTVPLKKYDKSECEAQYPANRYPASVWFGFDPDLHLCYGDKALGKSCMIHGGEGLVARRVSSCLHTLMGVRTDAVHCGDGNGVEVFVRVARHTRWIESVVWPD